MGEAKRKTLKAAPASSKRASAPVALHSDEKVPPKQSTKRGPSAKAAPRRASMPSSPTGPLPDSSPKVIGGRNHSGSLVTSNRDAQAATSAGRGASSEPLDAKATSAAPPSYLLGHITGDTSGTINSNSTATQPPTCTTNEGGYYVFGACSSIDTLSPVSSQQTASRGQRSAEPLRASERNATDDAHPLSLERISEERLSLSASSSQQLEGYFWNLAPSRSARHSVGGLAVPAAAVTVPKLPTAATPPPRLSVSGSTSFESGVPYSVLQMSHKRPAESPFTAPAGASWRRFSSVAPSAAENAAGHELGLAMRVSEANSGDVAASARARSARLASGTERQSRHTDDGDMHLMASAFDTPSRVGSPLPSFFGAPMSASRRTPRRPTRGGGGGESVLPNSVNSTNGGATTVGNDTDSTCASVAGWPHGGFSAFGDDADAFSMESAAGAGFQSFFAPGAGAASSADYSPSCSAHTRARPSLRPRASGVSTGLSIFNGLPSAGVSSSSSSDDDAENRSDASDRETVTHDSALPDARAPQRKPKRQQQLSPWSSLYGVAKKSLVPMPAKRGNAGPTLARQTSLFVGASQRGGVEEESDRDGSSDRDTTSPSSVSRRRCTLDRKGTLSGAAWALETGKSCVRTRNSRRGDSDSDSSSDEESSNGADASTTQHPMRNFSSMLIPQQRTSAAQRPSIITSYLNHNDSVSSVDVIADSSSSSSSDDRDTEEGRRAIEEPRRTSLQRVLSVMEKFNEIGSDDDDGEAEANTHVHEEYAETSEQANRRTAHRAPTPVPPSTAYGRYTNGRRTTTTAVAPPHFERTLPYQPYACSPQFTVLQRTPVQHQPYSSLRSGTPYGSQQAWGAGGGVHAVAYLHAQCSTSPNQYGADEVDDWQTQLADFTSPGLTTHSTATCNNSDLTESSPAMSTPLNGGPPTMQFRTTVTTLKVHELLGFDPLTEITTVRSPRWRNLPRHW